MRHTFTRDFYIPKDSEKREYPDLTAEVYYYKSGDKFAAACFGGKRAKPDQHYSYRTEEQRDKNVQQWLDGLKRNQEYKAKAKAEETGLMGPAHSARALKGYLQRFFPGIKFSVTSDTYSMGCSISVSYADGPTYEEVDAIVDLFRYGRFDGMADYSYSVPVHVPGCSGAKHTSVNRNLSDELKNQILPFLCDNYAPSRDGDYYHSGEFGNYRPWEQKEAELMLLGTTKEQIRAATAERINQIMPPTEAEEEPAEAVEVKPEPPPRLETTTEIKPVSIIDGDGSFLSGKWAKLNKNDTLARYEKEVQSGEYYTERMRIDKLITLTPADYDAFTARLLDNFDWIAGLGGTGSDYEPDRKIENIWELTEEELDKWRANSYRMGALVTDGKRQILVDPQGYNYARYVGLPIMEEREREPQKEEETAATVPTSIEEFNQESQPNNIISIDGPATRRQLWALHCLTKTDTREWKLTKREASELIKQASDGETIQPAQLLN